MKILVVAEEFQFEESRQKLGGHECTYVTSHSNAEKILSECDVIFDFLTSDKPDSFSLYRDQPVTVFLNAWRISLAQLTNSVGIIKASVFGFNGFPTMFNREYLEVSVLHAQDLTTLQEICGNLGTKYLRVDDRVGLVTPRVISMIINEAYYAVQEGTATRDDIDLAMKLGTNYPYGPFEWCKRIGLKNVYRLLEAVYEDTKDERYKISALMKKEFLGG